MNRIRELRKKRGMTQKELAEQMQIADSTLSYWEMGKYEPDNDSLIKLSKFFSVPIDYILDGDFVRWNLDQNDAEYLDVDLLRATEADMSVSEAEVPYSSNRNTQTSFNRVEFDGLTEEEIEKLAEYAVFIKSRRKRK